MINASAQNTKSEVGSPVTMNGYHNIYIYDNTSSTQQYGYHLGICTFTSDHVQQLVLFYLISVHIKDAAEIDCYDW